MHAYRDQYAKLFHGGRNVVLIGISADPAEELAAWARDDEFPFLMASDTGSVAGKQYGAYQHRTVYVVGPDGKIAWRAVQFREVDPTAYTELGAAVDRVAGADSTQQH
jgi:peroxiredoxin